MWEGKITTSFTTITPIPASTSRETAIKALHNHSAMIELNPLVIQYDRVKTPALAPAEEYPWAWFQLTDKLLRLPRRIHFGNVTYKVSFNDLPDGLQSHVYAPAGLEIKTKWTVEGNTPGEPSEPAESAPSDAPREGLYLHEDVVIYSRPFMTTYVKKTMRKAHAVLVERLVANANAPQKRRGSTTDHPELTYVNKSFMEPTR